MPKPDAKIESELETVGHILNTDFSNVDHPIWQGYGAAVRKDLETLQLFGLSQFRPLMLATLDVLSEEDTAKVIHIIVIVSMRYSIIGSLGPGNIEKA